MSEFVFSAPGRTEIGGNHTDHQHGCVLAAAVNLETRALVDRTDGVISIDSQGYPPFTISLSDLAKKPEEAGTTTSLVRGIAARFRELGAEPCGFTAQVSSTVLPGSGLSSSAAFEVLIGTILNHLCADCRFSPVEIAQIGQWAENNYFGKPCGLMDQTASAVGNIIAIDFNDPAAPVVERIDYDFSRAGHALCIIDSGASHADLTDEYAAITKEMGAVSAYFNKTVLRDVDQADFYAALPELRKLCGDRAVLRAMHFYKDNERAVAEAQALKRGDFDEFLRLVNESGRSSYDLLQNVIPSGRTINQEVALALAAAERSLGGRGAVRVHGGGFAGTVQAFVPMDLLESFREEMDRVLGDGACHVLSIRSEGGIREK